MANFRLPPHFSPRSSLRHLYFILSKVNLVDDGLRTTSGHPKFSRMNLSFLLLFGLVIGKPHRCPLCLYTHPSFVVCPLGIHCINGDTAEEPAAAFSTNDDFAQGNTADSDLKGSIRAESPPTVLRDQLPAATYHRYNPERFTSLYRMPARLTARSANQQRSQQPTWYLGKRSRGSWHLG